jgi:hypothetical protein
MMSSADKQEFNDQVLIRYLLGSLSEQEAERLDELGIADDAFAWRLSAVENDLVDAYVRGELSAEDLAQFKSSYLSSAYQVQKVEFAEALRSIDSMVSAAAQAAPARTVARSSPSVGPPERLRPWRWLAVPRLPLQWGFAGATVALLFAASYLLQENARLGRQPIEVQGTPTAVDQQQQELLRQLNDQRAANAAMAKELNGLRETPPNLDQIKTLSALLLPPTRGTGRIPTVSVPAGTNLVVLLLALEADEFQTYRVGLKDAATTRTVWRSGNLEPASSGTTKTVSLTFPARLLKQRNYVLELSGVLPSGRAKFISGYPIRVVIG